jgi:hypothetical protein
MVKSVVMAGQDIAPKEELNYTSDEIQALESRDVSEPGHPIVGWVEDKFNSAEDAKRNAEERALKAYNNFRGNYNGDTMFTESEKSRIFIKITKTKVLAGYGQIIDVLFGNHSFPLTIDHTTLPEGVTEDVSFDPMAPPAPQKQPMIGPEPLAPGTTQNTLLKLGPLESKLGVLQDKVQIGPGTTPTAVTFHPAHVAAKKMQKKILDQLDESDASKQLRACVWEMALFGTGIMKGPFTGEKEYPNWNAGVYEPTVKDVPYSSQVSFWNFYPDPDANNMEEAEWVVERHKMSRTQLNGLRYRPLFIDKSIDDAIDKGFNYLKKSWETAMEDAPTGISVDRFEVLEYWGFVPVEILKDHDIHVKVKDVKQVNVNIWVCNGEVLRCVINPFKPARIPYHAVPYELNPYSFFGIGVAENMEDTQLLMNGFMRLAVDNAVLSGNLIFEVDESSLSPDQDLTMYPGKVVRRESGAPGQAIFATSYPNVSQQNMMMFDKARVLADEATGLPSYAHGQTGVQGTGRTASGISMLMGAAAGSGRTVIKNVDDYLLRPLGEGYFAWNMQFDNDPDIKGDLEVNARGTESFMASEVRSQRLLQFLQVTANPILAPFVKLDVIVREIAKSMDLDPEKVTNSLADATVQAVLLQQMQAAAAAPPQGPPEGAPAGTSTEAGPGSGGGTMGTGNAPAPGAPGFAANTGEGG